MTAQDTAGLVERLRANADAHLKGVPLARRVTMEQLSRAADALEAMGREVAGARAALEWYGEQARLARLIHQEGDSGRHALAADGGRRARTVLSREKEA